MPNDNAANPRGRRFRPFQLRAGSSKDLPQQLDSRKTLTKLPSPAPSPSSAPAPKPVELQDAGKKQQPPVPVRVDKRQSKLNLFDLFSKPKVERARGFHEAALESLSEGSATSPQRAPAASASFPNLLAPLASPPPPPPPRKESLKKVVLPLAEGDPPPLFQVHQHSIKYGNVQTVTISLESLTRMQQFRNNKFDGWESLPVIGRIEEGSIAHPQTSRNSPHRFSAVFENLHTIDKTFVLVTDGRIVQYSGKGGYERVPEKILQLGDKSAAFASDLIPGRHWVIQVVQVANEDGAPVLKQSRSLLSKFRAPSARKSAVSFLMIFDGAEEMDSWLKAIRKTIELLGGPRLNSDPEPTPKRKGSDNSRENIKGSKYTPPHPLRQPLPSEPAENLSSVSPNLLVSPTGPPPPPPPKDVVGRQSARTSPRIGAGERDSGFSRAKRVTSMADSSSVGTSNASSDQLRLEQLRESSRYSIVSVGTARTFETETVATSRCSSSPPSPLKDAFGESEGQRSPPLPLRSSVNTSPASSTKRRSIQFQTSPTESTRAASHSNSPSPRLSVALDPLDRAVPAISAKPRSPPALSTQPAEPRGRLRSGSRNRSPVRRSPDKMLSPTLEEDMAAAKRLRPEAALGPLPMLASQSYDRVNHIASQTQPRVKLFMRPLPVRPSEPPRAPPTEAPPAIPDPLIPRRLSSLMYPIPIMPSVNPASISRSSRPPSVTYSKGPASMSSAQSGVASASTAAQALRRPISMHIHSDPAPFLSLPRHTRNGSRSSSAGPAVARALHAQGDPAALQAAWSEAARSSRTSIPPSMPTFHNAKVRQSIPAAAIHVLPPPPPPPNIPLPAPPPSAAVVS